MTCGDCVRWTPGTEIPFAEVPATYGLCKPSWGRRPFWAARRERDMQTNTRPDEGAGCAAFDTGKPN
jgi:hypothetical protein